MDYIQQELDFTTEIIKAGLSMPDNPLEGQRKYLESLGIDTRPLRYGCDCILCGNSFSSHYSPSIPICTDCIDILKEIVEKKRNEKA